MKPQLLEARLLNCLRQAQGAWVPLEVLACAMYGDREDGGPLDIANNIRQFAHRLRSRFYPVEGSACRGGSMYRFKPLFWEIADMTEDIKHGREIRRGKRASEQLSPSEAIRVARTIDSLKEQVAANAMNLANAMGWLAAKDHEIEALKKIVDEMIKQRDAAWAKPENLAGSETVVPG